MTGPEKGTVNESGSCLFRVLGRGWLGLGFVAILNILQDAIQAFARHFRPGRNFLDVGKSVWIACLLTKLRQERIDFPKNKKHFAAAAGLKKKFFVERAVNDKRRRHIPITDRKS